MSTRKMKPSASWPATSPCVSCAPARSSFLRRPSRHWRTRTFRSPSSGRRRMNRPWRRFEVMLPVAFNDRRPVPRKWFGNALREVVDRFGGGILQPQPLEGEWRYEGTMYHDKHLKLVVDVPDTTE